MDERVDQKMTKKKRRSKTQHPGVKLLEREKEGQTLYLARWTDPGTGKARELSLLPLGLSTAEARRAWAIKKSRALAAQRGELEATGSLPPERPTPRQAVAGYLDRCARLRGRTLRTYGDDLRRWLEHADQHGLAQLDELRAPALERYREHLLAQPLKLTRRGRKTPARTRRSPASVNRHLRSLRTFLFAESRLGYLPHLDREAIAEACRAVREARPEPSILRPAELQELLQAALRHDAATFELTREEKGGERTPGSTPRHPPIAPFLLTCLLTGCRLGELEHLPWSAVLPGELKLTPDMTKTKRGRIVTLEESPAVTRLLSALKLQADREPFVFGGAQPLPRWCAEAARRRLLRYFGAPAFGWQRLR